MHYVTIPDPVFSAYIALALASLLSSNHATIGAEHLAVDPAAIRADEEGDNGRDIFGCAKAFERVRLGEPFDELVGLAVEEHGGGGRARRYRVDGDRSAAHFL